MGIKNVNQIVKEKSPRAFFTVPTESITGKRIAIDSPLWFYTNISSLTKSYVLKMKDILEDIDRDKIIIPCLSRILRFHTNWLESDITCIWIEDGKVPKEKQELARKRRAEKRESTGDKIKALKDKLRCQDPLLRSKSDVEELRKLMCNYSYILPEEYELMYNIIDGFGLPHIKAPSEAEAFACSLNIAGLVYGVWTTDTDCYALGGINMITGYGDNENKTVNVVHIPRILTDMEFNQKKMLDFCIMCGTDFNDNIPRVGVQGAYKAIQEYGSITKYKKSKNKDCTILNYRRSRELLTAPVCELKLDSPELKHNKVVFDDIAKELSISYNLGDYYAKMMYQHDRDIPCELYEPSKKKKITIRIKEVSDDEEEKPAKLFIQGRDDKPTGKLIIDEPLPRCKSKVVIEELD